MFILDFIKNNIVPITAMISFFILMKPYFSRMLLNIRMKNADRINKKIAHYNQLKSNPILFYGTILTHVLAAFGIMGIAVAFDSIFQSNKQFELVYSWRILFGMMLYAVALDGVVSIKIITKDFDKTIKLLINRLKKIEDKNNDKK